jgi:hypothetical protein
MVIKMPKNKMATSLIGSQEKSFVRLIKFGVVAKANAAINSWANAAGIIGKVKSWIGRIFPANSPIGFPMEGD